jgi:hypothetical protein
MASMGPSALASEIGPNDFRISQMGPDGTAKLDAFAPAAAYNPLSNEYLVVWYADPETGPLDDDEYEIFGQCIDAATGAEVGQDDFRISDMGEDGRPRFGAFRPAVAYNSNHNEYLVVWYGDDGTGELQDDEYEIWGQRLDATCSEIGKNDFRISDMGNDNRPRSGAFDPAVAYNPNGDEYLVVWVGDDDTVPGLDDDEYEIWGQRIDGSTGAEIGQNDFRISDLGRDGRPRNGAFRPAVTYNPDADEYLVVWYGDDDSGSLDDDEYEIWGQRLSGNTGTEIGENDFRISDMGPDGDGMAGFNAFIPDVAYSSGSGEYLVVWYGDDDIGALVEGELEIFGQRLEGSTGAEVGANDFRISEMGPDGNRLFDAVLPAVTYNFDSDQYLVVWSGEDHAAPLVMDEFEIFAQAIDAGTGAQVGPNDMRLSDMGPDGNVDFSAGSPSVVWGAALDQYLAVWHGDDDTGALVEDEFEIYGQLFFVPEPSRSSMLVAGAALLSVLYRRRIRAVRVH